MELDREKCEADLAALRADLAKLKSGAMTTQSGIELRDDTAETIALNESHILTIEAWLAGEEPRHHPRYGWQKPMR